MTFLILFLSLAIVAFAAVLVLPSLRKPRCKHLSDIGTLQDFGRSKVFRCVKCGKKLDSI